MFVSFGGWSGSVREEGWLVQCFIRNPNSEKLKNDLLRHEGALELLGAELRRAAHQLSGRMRQDNSCGMGQLSELSGPRICKFRFQSQPTTR